MDPTGERAENIPKPNPLTQNNGMLVKVGTIFLLVMFVFGQILREGSTTTGNVAVPSHQQQKPPSIKHEPAPQTKANSTNGQEKENAEASKIIIPTEQKQDVEEEENAEADVQEEEATVKGDPQNSIPAEQTKAVQLVVKEEEEEVNAKGADSQLFIPTDQEEEVAKNQLVEYNGPCAFKGKVWCIGVFKTGTTSCGALLSKELGYTCKKPPCGFKPYYPNWMWDDAVSAERFNFELFEKEGNEGIVRALDETLSANDGPWLFMFEEFLKRYPLSRYIYHGRDPRDLINSALEHKWGGHGTKNLEELLNTRKKVYQVDMAASQMLVLRRYLEHEKRVDRVFSNPKHAHKLLRVNFTGATEPARQKVEAFLGCPISKEEMLHANAHGTYTRLVTDDWWNFLNTYHDYNFTNHLKPRHIETGEEPWDVWMESGKKLLDYFNST